MKKGIRIIVGAIMFLTIAPNVKASSCSVSASSTNVTVGSKVTVYVKGSDAIGRFNLRSSNTSVLSGASSVWVENNSSAVTFTANKAGTSTISVSAEPGLSNSQGGEISVGCNSVTIKVSEKTTSKPSTTQKPNTSKPSNNTPAKSSNNNLKSLSVEEYELSPKFDKGTTDYKLTVKNDVEKINIKAEKDNKEASVTGLGEKKVSEGMNKFEIVVTAENGYKKTYKINVEVEEEPITVTVNNIEYSVIKKENSMPEIPNYYDKTEVEINEKKVPAYKGTINDFVLVGLKDKEGNSNLYIYNNDTYILYKEDKFNQITLYLKEIDVNKIPEGYKKFEETINDHEVEVYKLNKNSNYSLIYGLNLETGKEGIYKYNSVENTIQLYEREEAKLLEKQQEKYEKFILILFGVIVFLILLVTIGFTRKRKEVIIEEEVANDFLSKKEIKKIEKNTKKDTKKNTKNKEVEKQVKKKNKKET